VGQARDWDDLALVDPFWAVLAADGKRGGGWELSEFLSTGEADVEQILATATQLGRPSRRERVLDFGCGVGRLTRALARRFDEAVGVDVSERMLEHARRLNADTPNVTFTNAEHPPAGRFDFVVANLVLQHLPSRALARVYIERLVEAARPDGLRGRVSAERLQAAGFHPVRMLALTEADVRATVDVAGATVAHTEDAAAAGLRYYVHHRSP